MNSKFPFLPKPSIVVDLKLNTLTEYTFPAKNEEENHYGFKSRSVTFDHLTGEILAEFLYGKTGNTITKKIYEEGKLRQQLNLKSNGDLDNKMLFEYDQSGKMIRKQFHLSDSELWYSTHIYYDAACKIEKEEIISRDKKMLRVDSYFYDSNNNLIKIQMGAVGENLYYYEKDVLIKEVENLAGGPDVANVINYYYDSNDLLRLVRSFNETETVIEYSRINDALTM